MTAILLQNDLNIKDTNPQIAEQTDMSKSEPEFGKLLDSKIKTSGDKNISKPKTLGDIKTKTQSVDDGLSRFKEILMKAAGEINVENSLDLTLGKDIGKIISQLKDAVSSSINPEKNIDEAAENSDFDYVASILNERKKKEADSDDEASEIIALMTASVVKTDNITENSYNNDSLKADINTDLTEEVQKTIIKDLEEELTKDSQDSPIDEEMLKELNIESIESNTDGSSGNEGFSKNQTPEEHSLKAILNQGNEKFDVNMVKMNDSVNSKNMSNEISPEKIIEQITKQLDSYKGNSKVNIVLNPESLGRVDLQIINTKEGLSAQFTVTTNEARELLMKGLDGLKETLLAQGVGVDNISVKINETEETSGNSDWTEQEGSRGGNKENNEPDKKEKEKGLFEKTIAQSLKEDNTNI